MEQSTVAPRSLKEKQRQEREVLILQMAEEVLMEKGYHETSVDEIAARVGIAKGTIYLHFPSKESLVIALFQRDMHTFLDMIAEVMDAGESARSKLEAILHCMYGNTFAKRMQMLSSIYNSAEFRHQWTEQAGCLRELWDQLSGKISVLLEQGKAAGEFDPTLPTSVMLGTFFSLLSPRSYERLMMEEDMTGERLVKHLGCIYFKGIAV